MGQGRDRPGPLIRAPVSFAAPHSDHRELPPEGHRTIAKMEHMTRGRDPAPGVARLLVLFKCPAGCGAIHNHNVLEADVSYS